MKKAIAALVFLLMALSINTPLALATDLPTQAEVKGGSSPPWIKAKWELPDDDPISASTQVTPTPGPPVGSGLRTEYCYLVATDNEGSADIFSAWIEVYHPDGSFKYKIHADKLDKENDNAEIMSALDNALALGHISQAVYDDIIYELEKCTAEMWKAEFILDYHQQAGWYEVRGYASDKSGAVSDPYVNYFYYYSIKVLYIDFSTVDFGDINPSTEKIIPGDENIYTPNKPTVRNVGNDNFWIQLHFTAMIGENLKQKIENFDAVFLGEKIYLWASETKTFSNPLEPCNTKQIDFSIHAPLGTPKDIYTGTLTIVATT